MTTRKDTPFLPLAGFLLAALGVAACASADGVFFEEATVPPRGGVYESQNGTGYWNTPVRVNKMTLVQNDDRPLRFPNPGETFQVDSFFDVFTEIGSGDNDDRDVDSFFDVFTELTFRGVNTSPSVFTRPQTVDIELVALNLRGADSVGMELQIRVGPSVDSRGHLAITTVGLGDEDGFIVDSFFDVWTEVSVDGGRTWATATDPLRMRLTPALAPEPATMTVLGLGALVVLRRRRRRRTPAI